MRSTPRGAVPPVQGPNGTSYFFSLLNRDVRNLIYNYITFGQIRTKDATQWVGFKGRCQQAKQEAEEESVRRLWLYGQNICRRFIKSTGYRLKLPRQPRKMEDFVRLTELTLITNAPVHILDLDKDYCPRTGLEDLVCIEIQNIALHCIDEQPPNSPKDLKEAAILMLFCLVGKSWENPQRASATPCSFHNSDITISWGYRNCTRENEYESLPTYQLKKELRNRGVTSDDMSYRKPAVIDVLLSQDANKLRVINATTLESATGSPQVLVGKRFYVVEVDGSLGTMAFEGDIPPFHANTNLFDPSTSRFYADTSLFYATNRRNSVGIVRLSEIHHCFGGGMCESLIQDVWDETRKED